jgi:hypothetical protein
MKGHSTLFFDTILMLTQNFTIMYNDLDCSMVIIISITLSLSVQDPIGAFYHGRQLHDIR